MRRTTLVIRTFSSTAFFLSLLHGASAYAASLDVSQQPLMLVDSVAPNLVFTLDDSGSMRWAFVPDSMGVSNSAARNTARTKSSAFNQMYYNPETTYLIPAKLNSDGTVSSSGFSTAFNSANHNGFQPGLGTRNLSTSYRVSWNDDINVSQSYSYTSTTNYAAPTGTVYNLAENPGIDFIGQCQRSNAGTCTYSSGHGALTYRLTRNSDGSCSAAVTFSGEPISGATCTRSSSTLTANLTRLAVPAYYYKYTPERCSQQSKDHDECYSLVRVSTDSGIDGRDERQNFAIWYSFYRNRALATLSAANLAFNELPASVRFTWQSLGNCAALNTTGCNNNRFRVYSGRHKYNFFEWMNALKFDQGTPLRASLDRAGKFLMQDIAWAADPNPFNGTTTTNPVLNCRPSYHILMTDGMWNGDDGTPATPFRHDRASFTLPDGTPYNGSRAPFADNTSNTLADLAMHYWATDLRPNMANEVKPFIPFASANTTDQYWDPRNNPATWQHMVNFNVGLALTTALNQAGLGWEGSTFAGSGYQSLKSGTRNWPAAASSSDNNVYDLWHAAINSRGEFFSADSPEEIVSAFQEIINRIAERTSTAAKPGLSTSAGDQETDRFSVTNRLFYSSYDSADWTGDVVRYNSVHKPDGSVTLTKKWSAQEKLPPEASRNIKVAGGAGATGLRDFTYANLSPALQKVFNQNPDALGTVTDSRGTERVEYLRGNRTREGEGQTDFRPRSSPLGDIVNSSPVMVGAPAYVPYLADRIDGTAGDYWQFYEANAKRTELVYVGANDGMLHAFNADTGREEFAFIPSAVLPNLPRLTGQGYKGGAHRFFVDGTPVVRDVHIPGTDGKGEWRTVLIGTLRAGGKSLFALDITSPSNIKLLWEISDATKDYGNLGYTFPQPEVVRLHSGQWAVLLGNGYDSKDDVASLFVIDIANGSLIKEITVSGGAGANGLSSVRGADNNGDGVVDYAYAGDLRGNLWRFDLAKTGTGVADAPDPFARSIQTNVSASDFKVSYGGKPLFTAMDPAAAEGNRNQAITAVPSIVRHPTRRGYLIVVGTGKYFETNDSAPDTSKVQTVYAIWDRKTRAQSTAASDRTNATRSNLQTQSITSELTATFQRDTQTTITREVRMVSQTPVKWYKDNTTAAQQADDSRVDRWGWALDLRPTGKAREGEMMVNPMLVRGDSLLISTLIPNEDPCADGTSGWVYAINATTGARTLHAALDFNRDGRFGSGDLVNNLVASGYKSDSPGGIALSGDGSIFGATPDPVGFSPSPELEGRQSWQVIPIDMEEAGADED